MFRVYTTTDCYGVLKTSHILEDDRFVADFDTVEEAEAGIKAIEAFILFRDSLNKPKYKIFKKKK